MDCMISDDVEFGVYIMECLDGIALGVSSLQG